MTDEHPPNTTTSALSAPPPRSGYLQLIGNTPLVEMTRVNSNPAVRLFAKLESLNPGGSIKDRTALAMIEHAEQSGDLTPDKIILEATSGNTGIGLAMIAAIKGYRILLAMSEGVSLERRQILAAHGAEFLLTPAAQGTDGAIEVVYEMAAKDPERYVLTDQYNNQANIAAHYNGTGLEIWNQTNHEITHLVATMGTTGTLMGCSRRLKELNPEIKIIGVEPYLGHHIQGLKNMKEAYLPGIYDRRALTEKINVEDEPAYEMSRRLAREEGLFVGMSSGAGMHVAVELAKTLDAGTVVVILPDGGERYLSTSLFQVEEEVETESKLRFVNSFTRRPEVFQPLDPKQVTMYTCGPTVHRSPHLGLYRRVVVADLVRRTAELAGWQVKHVMNITDIDDKTLEEAERSGEPLAELTARQTRAFMKDLETLGAKPGEQYPRASENVDQMVQLTEKLVQSGHAYERLKSVYFNIAKFGEYGKLSGVDLEKIQVGTTVDLDSYEKGDPRDFTLLKRSTLAELKRGVSYKTVWGNVRPGWHIECAVMAMSHLGEQFDIHVGGVDLIFPHHENEIALCQALTGKQPAQYWLHSGLVMVEGRKMSHSAGNAVSVRDLLALGYSGRQLRGYLLATHYRQPLHYSRQGLDSFCVSLRRLDEFARNLSQVKSGEAHDETALLLAEFGAGFKEAIFDDLNVSAALAALFRLVRRFNRRLAKGLVGQPDVVLIQAALEPVGQLLGIFPTPSASETKQSAQSAIIEELVQQREEARRSQDFATADRLRLTLEQRGILIEDTPDGPRWREK